MKWIPIKDKLPKHKETIHAYTEKGQCICIFIDSIEMNKTLCSKGYSEDQVNVNKKPYYFCSQEIQGHTLKGVTHWRYLPEVPNDVD